MKSDMSTVAVPPVDAREAILTYEGGSVSAAYGVLKALFKVPSFRWVKPRGTTPSGRRKQYTHRMRALADAGQPVTVRLTDGEVWQVRVTGTMIDFIDKVLADGNADNVMQIWTARGSLYGPEPDSNVVPVD